MCDVLPSSLRSARWDGRFTARVLEHPLANLGGPRDRPGAGRPRPPRGQARVAARLATPAPWHTSRRLATPQPACRLTSLAHYGDVDPSIDGSGGSRCKSDAVPPL